MPVTEKNIIRGLLAVVAAMPILTLPARLQAQTLTAAIENGTPSFQLRYRFESVDDDAFAENAYASTLRAALGYTTGRWQGLSATVQIQSVIDLGFRSKHNNTGAGSSWNGVTSRPVIADPADTAFDQAYLDWNVGRGTHVRAGRQEILLDNVRFVGNVGWRQFHQSFDAVTLTSRLDPAVRLTYAYVFKQNRIFTDHKEMNTHLLNLTWKTRRAGSLTAYAYRIDYDAPADSALSTATIGLRWHGTTAVGAAWKGLYDLETAHQTDAGDNPRSVDANYYRATVGAAKGVWTVKAGYEVLESSPGDGSFTTPLATLHAWNGWADRFLKTPADGLVDLNLTVAARVTSWNLAVIYHDFSADTGGDHYGSEIDCLATWTSPWRQVFALKAAVYDADRHATDVTKLWAFTSWKF